MTSPDPRDVSVQSTVRRYRINSEKVTQIVRTVGSYCGLTSFQLNVVFVAPTQMRQLNRRFRSKDRSTDVLSFPQREWVKPIKVRSKATPPKTALFPDPLGDIVISVQDAEHNAKSIGQPLSREVCFLLVHGFLHLCGHDHMTVHDERRMLGSQKALFHRLEGRRPPIWLRLASVTKPQTSRARGTKK